MFKRALTVGIAVVALLAVAAPAQSQEYPPPTNGIFISDSTVVAGQIIVIQAGVFAPGSTVTFNFFSQPVLLGVDTADAGGIAVLEAAIPANATAGTHTIVASGVAPDGSPLEVSTNVTVLADADDDGVADDGVGAGTTGGGLPRTGSESLPLARVAAALVALGGGLLFITRRRRTTIA